MGIRGLAIAAAILLTGCASGYKEFYRPATGVDPARIAERRPSPPTQNPIVERGRPENPATVLDAYAKRGYILIGSSTFNSGRSETEAAAVHQGVEVQADLVLILNPQYTGSVTTNLPMTTPTTSTTYSSGTATAYGPGGPVTAYGQGTSTTYGTTTTFIPMTVHRSDYGALYFVKQRFAFGAFTRDLSDAERKELQTNRGAVIRLVVDGSPAFDADVLVGDIVTAIDGATVSNPKGFSELLQARSGKQITVSLLRRGQAIQKTIQLAQ